MTLIGLILLIALAAAGALALTLGLRGRRINDHPHCRRCRFDLSGLDIDAADARCPECGGQLNRQKAIRIGARRRRPRLAAAGACLFLLGAGGLTLTGVVIVRGVDIDRYTPARILLLQVDRADQARRASIAAELIRRMEDGALRPADHRRAALWGIGHLERDGAAWTPEWFDIIEPARRMGLLEENDAVRYLRALAQPRLIARSRVRSEDTVPIMIGWSIAPTPFQSPLMLRLRTEFEEVTINGVSHRPNPRRIVRSTMDISGAMGGRGSSSEIVAFPLPVDAGPFEIAAELKVSAIAWDPANRRRALDQSPDEDIRYEWKIKSVAAAETLPHGEDSISLTIDDEMRDAMREGVTVDKVLIRTDRPRSGNVTIPVQIRRLPFDIAFSALLLRKDGETMHFDAFTHRSQTMSSSSTVTFSLHESYHAGQTLDAMSFLEQSEHVDVIFRPDKDRARQAIDLEDIWGEEIIFRDVPVIREDADGVRTPGPQRQRRRKNRSRRSRDARRLRRSRHADVARRCRCRRGCDRRYTPHTRPSRPTRE